MCKFFPFLIFTLFFLPKVEAQKIIAPDTIFVNYDKVVHVVFANGVEYVTVGSNNIEAIKVENAPNVIRVLALEEDFENATNLTIITKEGSVYTYTVSYREGNIQSVFFPDSDEILPSYEVKLNTQNTALLIFPSPILYWRIGNELLVPEQLNTKNIIKISATDIIPSESNIFCIDDLGRRYDIAINYDSNTSYSYIIGEAGKAIIKTDEQTLDNLCKIALTKPRKIVNQGVKQYKSEFSLNNVLIEKEQLYLVFQIDNKSNIDLDIDFVKCFFIDEKKLKNSVQQETVVDYIHNYNFKEKISSKSRNSFILVFPKFTIPDKKLFKIEIYEKGGGRHINFNIRDRTIINAMPLT